MKLGQQGECLLQMVNKNAIPGCFQILQSCFQVNSVFLLLVVTFGNRSAIIHQDVNILRCAFRDYWLIHCHLVRQEIHYTKQEIRKIR